MWIRETYLCHVRVSSVTLKMANLKLVLYTVQVTIYYIYIYIYIVCVADFKQP